MAQRRNPSAVDEKDSNATFVNTNADDHRTTVAKAYHWLETAPVFISSPRIRGMRTVLKLLKVRTQTIFQRLPDGRSQRCHFSVEKRRRSPE